jgi:hypothetical protein
MFTPSQDDRETLGQGLRLPGALRDLRKDAFWPLEPGIQTGEMRPVPVRRDGGCFVLWALPGRLRGSSCQVVGIGPLRKTVV